MSLLELQNISKSFSNQWWKGKTVILPDISFQINKGEIVSLIGQNGSGKSTIARIIVDLIKPDSGKILFHKQDQSKFSYADRKAYYRQIRMSFQNPDAAFNPAQTIGQNLTRVAEKFYKDGFRKTDRAEILALLTKTNLSDEVWNKRPHQLSGGQRRRAMIVRSLIGEPELLITDEPTVGLDINTAESIVNIFINAVIDTGLSILLLSHDLRLAQQYSDRLIILLGGRIVEIIDHKPFQPNHPYSMLLLNASRDLLNDLSSDQLETITQINTVGCPFSSNCQMYKNHPDNRCVNQPPILKNYHTSFIACWQLTDRKE
jgi:ABC-type oligopeptide transport system ATPase subunit